MAYAGFDRSGYPGNNVMSELLTSSNAVWTGFYLAPAPSHPDTGWMDRYAALTTMGWNVVPIYVGQQEAADPGSHHLSAAQGTVDAQNAVGLAVQAGFPQNVVIYLDVESGGPLSRGMLDYYQAWVQGVVDNGATPGVYCSHLVASVLLTTDPRPRVWTWKLKPNQFPVQEYDPPLPAPDPPDSGVAEARIWQFVQNCSIGLPSGTVISPVDLDSATVADPSAP